MESSLGSAAGCLWSCHALSQQQCTERALVSHEATGSYGIQPRFFIFSAATLVGECELGPRAMFSAAVDCSHLLFGRRTVSFKHPLFCCRSVKTDFCFILLRGDSDLFVLWDGMFSMEICLAHRGIVLISLLPTQGSRFLCGMLQRPIFKTSEFEVGKGLLMEKMPTGEDGRMPYSFCKSILREPRFQASFMSGEGRRGRARGVCHPGTSRDPRKSTKPLNLFVPLLLWSGLEAPKSLPKAPTSSRIPLIISISRAGAVHLKAKGEMQARMKRVGESQQPSLGEWSSCAGHGKGSTTIHLKQNSQVSSICQVSLSCLERWLANQWKHPSENHTPLFISILS